MRTRGGKSPTGRRNCSATRMPSRPSGSRRRYSAARSCAGRAPRDSAALSWPNWSNATCLLLSFQPGRCLEMGGEEQMRQPLQGRVGGQDVQAVRAVLVIDLQDAQVLQCGQCEQGVEVILVGPQVQLL